jgi:chromosomal replication initiation ATPase DnaA
MSQIALKFKFEEDYSSHNFVESICNEEALRWIKLWPEWSSHCIIIYGPESCGKTHIASVWKELTINLDKECVLIEDIDENINEKELFHLYNDIKNNAGSLLLTSKLHPSKLELQLPDLRSRLKSCPAIAINPPDDMILTMLMTKLFADRQLKISKNVLEYVLARLERSFKAAAGFVNQIDSLSLIKKRNITIPLAKEVLEKL